MTMFEWQLQFDDKLPPLRSAERWLIRQQFARGVGNALLNNWDNVQPRKGRVVVQLRGDGALSVDLVQVLVAADRIIAPEVPIVTLAKGGGAGCFQLTTYAIDHGEVRRTDQGLADYHPGSPEESVQYWKNKALEVAMGESSVVVREAEVDGLMRYIKTAVSL